MQLTVTGQHVDVGNALRGHIEAELGAMLSKYFGTAIEAHAIFARQRHLIRAEISLHIGRGIVVNSSASATEHYLAFDAAAERLAKQLRRYKRRLREHHKKVRATSESPQTARSFVLAPVDEEDEDDGAATEAASTAPVVIAEMTTELPELTVGEAVMRMDLADNSVLLFRNRSHGGLNLVYRRTDGNIGWIDPAFDGSGQPRRDSAAASERRR